MPKKKRKKQQTPGTPRVGNTTAKPKSNKPPALAEYVDQITNPIVALFKGKRYEATVESDGQIKYDGKLYRSPSAAGMAIAGRPVNGWTFWAFEKDADVYAELDQMRGKKSPLKTKEAAA